MKKPSKVEADKKLGGVIGQLVGDATGAPYEFFPHTDATLENIPDILKITDDTQMTLHVMKAAQDVATQYSEYMLLHHMLTDEEIMVDIRERFMYTFANFNSSPHNDRAPGKTCVTSIKKYETIPLDENPNRLRQTEGNDSKGNGTVMRAGWLGMLDTFPEIIFGLSVLQSEVTHEHPYATVCSAVMSLMVRKLIDYEGEPESLKVDQLIAEVFSDIYDYLEQAPEYKKKLLKSAQELEQYFLDLYKHDYYREWVNNVGGDLSVATGLGWVAEEALAAAICALANVVSGDLTPLEAILMLVGIEGDSDTVAAIGGCLIGSLVGTEPMTQDCSRLAENFMNMIEPLYFESIFHTYASVVGDWVYFGDYDLPEIP